MDNINAPSSDLIASSSYKVRKMDCINLFSDSVKVIVLVPRPQDEFPHGAPQDILSPDYPSELANTKQGHAAFNPVLVAISTGLPLTNWNNFTLFPTRIGNNITASVLAVDGTIQNNTPSTEVRPGISVTETVSPPLV
jgi:hypothetical protein